MTVKQIEMAAHLCAEYADPDGIVDLREIGSEGCILRTIVPGPLQGPGAWLIARNGDAASYEGKQISWEEI